MEVKTHISYGYVQLLDTFFKANDLIVSCVEIGRNEGGGHGHTTIIYEDGSPTAEKITFMSFIHVGFENMLCDYLIRCGIYSKLITVGSYTGGRDMAELDSDCEAHIASLNLSQHRSMLLKLVG